MKNFITADVVEKGWWSREGGRDGWRRLVLLATITAAITLIGCFYAISADETDPWHHLPILFSFVSLGVLIKYGDQAFDEEVFSQKYALILAIPAGFWVGVLIAFDAGSRTILTGLLFALLVAAKYDNPAFRIGFLIAILTGTTGMFLNPDSTDLIGIGLVFMAAYVDERINEVECVERGTTLFMKILRERPVLKVMVLLLCALSILPSYLYFFAFLAFDSGYSFMECVSRECMNDVR